jgi:2-amino-4-hydroxy-6-hydroxymethyldihydropteridine diphosphokinase
MAQKNNPMSLIFPQYSQAFIALGSNLENPISHVRKAFDELDQLPLSKLLVYSSLYRSAPVGRKDQPDFINAVASIETKLTPYELLSALLNIEKQHGRTREFPNAPRTLDLDILLYDDLKLHQHNLTLPHPRMGERAFVLYPLIEIAPKCHIPGLGVIAELLSACQEQRVERITS